MSLTCKNRRGKHGKGKEKKTGRNNSENSISMELWLPGEIFLCFQGLKKNQERVLKRNMRRDFFKGLKWQEKREWIKTGREEVKVRYWEGILGIEGGHALEHDSMDSPSLEVSKLSRMDEAWSHLLFWRCPHVRGCHWMISEVFFQPKPSHDGVLWHKVHPRMIVVFALPWVGGGRKAEPAFLPMFFFPLLFVPGPRLSSWRKLRWLHCWSLSGTSWVVLQPP